MLDQGYKRIGETIKRRDTWLRDVIMKKGIIYF